MLIIFRAWLGRSDTSNKLLFLKIIFKKGKILIIISDCMRRDEAMVHGCFNYIPRIVKKMRRSKALVDVIINVVNGAFVKITVNCFQEPYFM